MRAVVRRVALATAAEFDLLHTPVHARVWLATQLAKDGLSQDEADEAADEDWLELVAYLITAQANAEARYESVPFAFNSSDQNQLQGRLFVQPNDSLELASAKRNRLLCVDLEQFLLDISWREFELCCKRVLDVLGCSHAVMTPRGSDGGIDFHGLIPLEGRLGNVSHLPGFDAQVQMWLAGQAKQVSNPVGTGDIRELVGSVRLARAGTKARGSRGMESFQPRVSDPVLSLFFTTSFFTAEAASLLDAAGIARMNRSQLAEFLADNSVGVDSSGAFDHNTAVSWLEET